MGADRVAGQLRGDKEYPFSGVTKSGRVWRKVPESGARSVMPVLSIAVASSRTKTTLSLTSGRHVRLLSKLKQNEAQSARAESTHKGVN